ncbi:MAG: fatty acid desaturase [Rhodocyclales bacterium]|nr:fatty acid desaturase [Rhodocyclales bacterium]
MPAVASLKEHKRGIVDSHVKPDSFKGLVQVVTTLLPLAALWCFIALTADVSWLLTAAATLLMSLFVLRVFVLMHECGHGSLFREGHLNRTFGFVFGVVSGMPQHVWSQHHQRHHSTNGNWSNYRGPLNIIGVDEYAAMSVPQQRRYRRARNIWLAPLAGFLYLLLNPRLTWLRGSIGLARHVINGKLARPDVSIREHAHGFKTTCWSSRQEYRHMLWNNLVLLSLWGVMAWLIGPILFFTCYTISMSLAGAAGILLFSVQHNFEHSYASHDEGWDHVRAAIDGTSFLVLPRWLNWFTANIAYHHIHHLSARIPNYCLIACHKEHQHLFANVRRIRLGEVPAALKYILWDKHARRIVSVAEHEQQRRLSTVS